MKKLLISFVALILILSSISVNKAYAKESFVIQSLQSYKDIPGVTQEEIHAIESLKASRKNFIYGHLLATEAFILPDGTYAGFTTSFCKLLTNIFGIEFVQEITEWDQLLQGLDNKTIDFTGELTQNPERLQHYYMTDTIAERALRIFTCSPLNDFKQETELNNLSIGFLTGSITPDAIQNSYDISYKKIDIDNYSIAVEKLRAGEIDIFVEEAVSDPAFIEYKDINTKEFFSLVFSPVTLTTGNPELKPIISVVNKYIQAGGIDVLYQMYKEGNNEYSKYKLYHMLTDEEKAYLDNLKTNNKKVKIAFEHENYPVSFYNEEDNAFQGFAIDILTKISYLTDIEFEPKPQPLKEWSEIMDELKSGEISMVTQLLYTDARKKDFLWSKVPYAHSYYALISKSTFPSIENYQVVRTKVGTIANTAFEEVYKQSFHSNNNTISYNTQNDALQALEKGDIDLLMASEYTLLTQINYRENPEYKINIRFNRQMDSFFGYNKSEKILCSIIDKALVFVNTEAIVNGWTNRVFDYKNKYLEDLMLYLMVFTISLLIVLIFITLLLLKNRMLRKRLEKVASTDGLTEIYNRRYFIELVSIQIEKALRTNAKSYIIIFDLDHFKLVNDRHGHSAGDHVLKTVVSRVKETIRPYDVFARYGGEEFILFITEIADNDVFKLAERIRLSICSLPIYYNEIALQVSSSFGISSVTPYYDFDTAVQIADEALYEAKAQGRNRVVFTHYDKNESK